MDFFNLKCRRNNITTVYIFLTTFVLITNEISTKETDDNSQDRNFLNILPTPTNRITAINTNCTSQKLSVTITMEKPFKGIIFAKGFPQECNILGIFEHVIVLNLPTSGCGVRLSNKMDQKQYEKLMLTTDEGDVNFLQYTVTIIVQMDRFLQQIVDQERTVTCTLDSDETKLRSNGMRQIILNNVKKDSRTGRMKSDWSTDMLPSDLNNELEVLDNSRAWMEIAGDTETNSMYKIDDIIKVGETMILTIKTTLPANVGWRIINCMAHDGIGDSSQKLLDDYGCPIDEQILPALEFSTPRMIGPSTNKLITKRRKQNRDVRNLRTRRVVMQNFDTNTYKYPMMRYQEASTKFPAFKFPDRDRLHLTCGLQLCKASCQEIDCTALRRSSRHLTKKNMSQIRNEMNAVNTLKLNDEILDTLEVYNSVEVIAPEIEIEEYRGRRKPQGPHRGKPILITNIPGDRAFCVSTNKMAIAFCVLGVIFIIAVVVAIISLFHSRRKDMRSYYSRSLFSSSISTGSGFGGSKLLLHDSPCLGTTIRRWQQYGRNF